MCSPVDKLLAENAILGYDQGLSKFDLQSSTVGIEYVLGTHTRRNDRNIHIERVNRSMSMLEFWRLYAPGSQINSDMILRSGGQNARAEVFKAKSKELSTGVEQYGFIMHYEGRLSMVYCTCKDFHFRSYNALYQRGMAPHISTIPGKMFRPELSYTKNTGAVDKYGRKAKEVISVKSKPELRAKETNPLSQMFMCKHLYEAMNKLVG